MENNWLELVSEKMQLEKIMEKNSETEQYGLNLSKEEAQQLLKVHRQVLQKNQRAEFGSGILLEIIYEFCDSDYIDQSNYVETLMELQELFYLYKNEMLDEITDKELLHFMREQFDKVCFGDLEYLGGTCLEIFASAIRAGYEDYKKTEGYGDFTKMDIVARWDYGLYQSVLQELVGR